MSPQPAPLIAISEPAILIRVPRLYRRGMTGVDLYDIVRGIWRVGPNRDRAKLAFAVVDGHIIEAYEIHGWFPAGTTVYASGRRLNVDSCRNRWEFTGTVASSVIRDKYRGQSVLGMLPHGAQNPVRYVNCGPAAP
jgi:uncharacterized protein